MKTMQNFLKIISLTLLSSFFSLVLMAADDTTLKNKSGESKPKKSSKYLDSETLKLQKEEEEKINQSLRNKNEIEVLYSEKYRNQNSSESDLFEEEILKSQINDTGVFINSNNKVLLSKKEKTSRIKAVQEGILLDYNKDMNEKKLLNFKNPLFFVSEGVDTFSYTNSMDLCSLVNLESDKVDCLVYPEEKLGDIPFVLRRGQNSDMYEQLGLNADFIIVRDDIYSQYKKGRGAIAAAPDLDIMMYLNGDYLFMFANSMFNTFSYEHLSARKLDKTIRVGYINQQSRVIFDRTLAKLFPRHSYSYKAINVSTVEDARESICNPTDIDVFIYFGGKIPSNLQEAMNECSSIINPLTLSDGTLNEVVKLTDFFSVANVVGYYPVTSVINYLEIYIALEASYKKEVEENIFAREDKINLADYSAKPAIVQEVNNTNNNVKMSPRERERLAKIEKAEKLKKQREEERTKKIKELKEKREEKKRKEEELKAKKLNKTLKKEEEKNKDNSPSKWSSFMSILNFGSESNLVDKKKEENLYLNQELVIKEDSLNKIKGKSGENKLLGSGVYTTLNEQKEMVSNSNSVYVTANTAIKTFGIRYVMLGSRYAKRENVIDVFDSVIKDFFLVRESVLTPDISKFSVSDIILGSSGEQSVISNEYHPALAKYPNYLLESKSKKTPEQTIALKLLNVNSDNVLYPQPSGPGPLTPEELDILYSKVRETNKRKEELATIRIYQRDTISIDKALEDMRKGNKPSDSLLKTTGLDYVNVIIDEQSVLSQGMSSEEILTPDAMRELDKLINPEELPIEMISAEDVKNSVEASEGDIIAPKEGEEVTNSVSVEEVTDKDTKKTVEKEKKD